LPAGGLVDMMKADLADGGEDDTFVDDSTGEENEEELPMEQTSLFADTTLRHAFFGMLTFATSISGRQLLQQIMLTRLDSVGFYEKGKTSAAVSGATLKQVGFLSLTAGLCALLMTVAIYPRLFQRGWSDACLIASAIVMSAVIMIVEPMTTEFWQLYVISVVTGLCVGIATPAVNPLMSAWASIKHPHQMAASIAFPSVGLAVGLSAGPAFTVLYQNAAAIPVFGIQSCENGQPVAENHPTEGYAQECVRDSLKAAYWTLGFIYLISAYCYYVFASRVERAAKEFQVQVAEEQKTAFEGIGKGIDPAVFVQDCLEKTMKYLKDNKHLLNTKPIQDLVRHNIMQSMPDLPPWKEATNGYEYLNALNAYMELAGLGANAGVQQALKDLDFHAPAVPTGPLAIHEAVNPTFAMPTAGGLGAGVAAMGNLNRPSMVAKAKQNQKKKDGGLGGALSKFGAPMAPGQRPTVLNQRRSVLNGAHYGGSRVSVVNDIRRYSNRPYLGTARGPTNNASFGF